MKPYYAFYVCYFFSVINFPNTCLQQKPFVCRFVTTVAIKIRQHIQFHLCETFCQKAQRELCIEHYRTSNLHFTFSQLEVLSLGKVFIDLDALTQLLSFI